MFEHFVSIDVETAGPCPSRYPLLSIGACLVTDPARSFYVELQPVPEAADPEALRISGLSLERLREEGLPPREAMERFAHWLRQAVPHRRPVFVAMNAAFDWMFVNDYFHRYLGFNPFGHAALDIKSFFMALRRVPWEQTGWRHIAQRYLPQRAALAHNALQDAQDQARAFLAMLQEALPVHPQAP